MLWSTALKEIKRHLVMNLLIFIELAVTVILVAVMVSSVMIRYKYYSPFKDLYSSDGLYCEFTKAASTGAAFSSMEEFLDGEDIFPFLSSPEMIVCSDSVMAFPMKENENVQSKCYSFNDELISRYTPELAEGEWFDIISSGGTIEAVISENENGWRVGDVIPVQFACKGWDGQLDVKIIGMLEKGTKLPCITHEHTGDSNSNMVFSEYDIEENECPLMLFSYSQLKARNVFQSINCAFIKYKDGTSYETLLDDQKQITRLGGVFSATLSEINDNSISYFKVQIFNYLPIIIVVLILTLVSSISITALSTRRRLHDYGIYYLCGLKWKSCCLVNLFWAIMAESAAVIAAALFITFSGRLPLIGKITVLPNMFSFSAAAAVLLIFTAGSMLMPLIIIGNSTPKEILSRGDA